MAFSPEQLLQLALARGLITPAQVADVERELGVRAVGPQAASVVERLAARVPALRRASGRLGPAPTAQGAPGPPQASSGVGPGVALGPYVVTAELGRGGMGVVFRARHQTLGRDVAIKLVSGALDERARTRLRLEAEAVARLRHPGIVAIHDVGEHAGRPFLVMDLVAGEALGARLSREGCLAPREAARLTAAVARALHHAHEHQTLHRDVKPQNVIVTPTGEPVLIDFGLAKQLGKGDGPTRSGQLVGTPGYMAPEQASREAVQDWRVDVYGAGGLLFALLTGRPPFQGDSLIEVLAAVGREAPPAPSRLRAGLHRDLDVIALRCLEKEPAARYPSAQALADDLERWLAGRPIVARPASVAERATKWARRDPQAAGALAVAALVIATATVGGAIWRARVDVREARAQEEAARREERARAEARDAARAASAAEAQAAAEGAWSELQALSEDAERTGAALRAAQSAQRWRDVAGTPEAAQALHRAAMALGEVALEGEQWALAREAFVLACGLGVDDLAAARAVERVGVARRDEAARRAEAVRDVLAAVERGEASAREGGLVDAVFELTRYPDAPTVELLAARLDAITARLLEVEASWLREAARPTPEEAARGEGTLEGLDEALAWRRANVLEGAPMDDAPAGVLARASGRLARRVAARDLRQAQRELGALQGRALTPGQRDLAGVASEALGRLELAAAAPALSRYLAAEADPVRAIPAGLALCRLARTDQRALDLLHQAQRRFGHDGAFALRIGRAIPRAREDRAAQPTAPALLERGMVRLMQGDFAGAEEDFRRAAEDPAHALDALIALTAGRSRAGDVRGALEYARQAAERHPAVPEVWNNLGRALMDVGERAEALAALDRALALAPERAQTLENRGRLRRDLGDLPGALADLDAALAADPTPSDRWVQRAITRGTSGDMAGALADLDEALARDPNHVGALVNRCRVRVDLEDLSGAIADADAALRLDRRLPVAWFNRACARRLAGDLPGALADVDEVLRLAPDDLEVLLWRGAVRAEASDPTGARRDLERVLERAPEGPQAARAREALATLPPAR